MIKIKKSYTILGSAIIIILTVFIPRLAAAAIQTGAIGHNIAGSTFINMFPSWISLAGGIIILVLAIKHMSGGALSKPFILIGIGVLIDALMQIYSSIVVAGVMPITQFFININWIINLSFRLSVVIGLIWIAGIFGILRQK